MIFISAALQQHHRALSSVWSHLPSSPISATSLLQHFFRSPILYSLPLVYPLGNANSHLPFFQSRYLYDNVVVTRFFSSYFAPLPLSTPCWHSVLYFILKTPSHEEFKNLKDWESVHTRILLEVNDNKVLLKTNLTWTELLTQQNEVKTRENSFRITVLRKAKNELVCLQRVSEKLRDTQYDSFAHISWFKTRKTSDLDMVVVQRTRIV